MSDYWRKPPKPENGLPNDGDYYARAGKGLAKMAHNGESEFLEIPFTIDEGEYAGEEVKVSFFYFLRGEEKQIVLDKLKKISDQIHVGIRETANSQDEWLSNLLNILQGRKVKLNQRSKDGKAYLEIIEVYEPELMQVSHSAPPLSDDAPF